MKKILITSLIIALALIVIGGAGVVFASVRGMSAELVAPWAGPSASGVLNQEGGFGPGGMMGGYSYGNRPGGMMGGYGYGNRPGGMMGGYGYGNRPGGMMGAYGYQNHHQGMMGEYGYGYGPGGMMGGRGFGYAGDEGPMHDYMIAAFAEAVDLTVDEVETRLEAGESPRDIAIAQGIAEADLAELFTQVHQSVLAQAVADGLITQAQADFMLERMNNIQGPGFGQGFGPGYGHESCPMWGGQQP